MAENDINSAVACNVVGLFMFATQGRAWSCRIYYTDGHILQASLLDREYNSRVFLALVANHSIRLDGYRVLVPKNP